MWQNVKKWCNYPRKPQYSFVVVFLKVPQPDSVTLLPRRLSCSITKAVLILGSLLLLLFGGWLLHTIYWLRTTSGQAHRPPSPASGPASGPVLQAEINHTVSAAHSQACSVIPAAWRFDCYPERGVVVTRELCEARKCCFIPASSSARGKSRKNGIPWCFYPPDFPSYSLVSLNDTSMGLKGTLVKDVKTYYPGDILTLEMEIKYETDTRLHVRVSKGAVLVFQTSSDLFLTCDSCTCRCCRRTKAFVLGRILIRFWGTVGCKKEATVISNAVLNCI